MKTAGLSQDTANRLDDYLSDKQHIKISSVVSLAVDRLLDELASGALWEELAK